MKAEINFDYYGLKGFIYSNRELKNACGLASFLGIKPASLKNKMLSKIPFSQNEIMKIKEYFNLTPEEVVKFFFTRQTEEEIEEDNSWEIFRYNFINLGFNKETIVNELPDYLEGVSKEDLEKLSLRKIYNLYKKDCEQWLEDYLI